MIRTRLAIFLVAAFALRCALFTNPVIHVDEQFYLLVGDRFLGGAVPYVDIWDRKPIGLFVVFAAIRLLGGDGVIAYQVVATAFAAATALIAAQIADRLGARSASLAAGLLYLIWLMIFDGAGGQSPVFYNLPMAGAALIVIDQVIRPGATNLRWRGVAAMALVGFALQLKYTVVFEGLFLGLTLLFVLRRRQASAAMLAAHAALWAGIALAPTVIALLAYVAIGYGDAFLYANFLSIFDRGPDGSAAEQAAQLAGASLGLLPLVFCAIIGIRRLLGAEHVQRSAGLFMLGWTLSAGLAIMVVATFRAQYFLPLLVPLSIASTPALMARPDLQKPDRRILIVLLGLGLLIATFVVRDHVRRRGDARQVASLVALIGQRPARCLFVFSSEPILYHLTHACLATRYVFRSHLGQLREAQAIGVDQAGEVRRILSSRPGVIVMRTSKDNADPAVESMLHDTLKRHYRGEGSVTVGTLRHSVYRLTRTDRNPPR